MSESKNLVVREALDEKITWAKALASSNLLPPAYQRQPANLLLAAEYADTLGVPRMTALTGIHVISGKPSMGADLMMSLVRRAGHRIRVSGDDQQAVATIVRSDDPEFEYRAEWTMQRAKQAGLLGKAGSNWAKYPAAMLRARAITEVCRMGASEVLFGAVYTPEELGAIVDAGGDVIDVPAEVVNDAAPASETEPGPEVSEAPATPAKPASEAQGIEIQDLAEELGLSQDVLAKTAQWVADKQRVAPGGMAHAAHLIEYLRGRLEEAHAEEDDDSEEGIQDAELVDPDAEAIEAEWEENEN